MNTQDIEEMSRIWISTEFNPVVGENIWQSQDLLQEAQQNDQQDLQIILQEVIDMINILINAIQEETTLSNAIQEETTLSNAIQEEMTLSNAI